MNSLINILRKSDLLAEDLDYHLIGAAMVTIFLFFGYQKWFTYEAQVLIPYISNGPLIFWLYPVFGIRGASWFLGVSEWTLGAFLLVDWPRAAGAARKSRLLRGFPERAHSKGYSLQKLGAKRNPKHPWPLRAEAAVSAPPVAADAAARGIAPRIAARSRRLVSGECRRRRARR